MAPALGNEGGADAAAGARADHPPATLRILNRDIVTMRASLAGSPPAVRVQRARDRLRDIPESAIDQPINVVPLVLGQDQGVQFLLGDHLLFAVLRGDVDPEAKQSFDALVAQTRSRVEDARKAWHASRDTPLLETVTGDPRTGCRTISRLRVADMRRRSATAPASTRAAMPRRLRWRRTRWLCACW
jgi:hypothetical protein